MEAVEYPNSYVHYASGNVGMKVITSNPENDVSFIYAIRQTYYVKNELNKYFPSIQIFNLDSTSFDHMCPLCLFNQNIIFLHYYF